MPTWKKVKDEMRSFFGIGEKNYETGKILPLRSNVNITVIAVVRSQIEAQRISEEVLKQTLKPSQLVLVLPEPLKLPPELFSHSDDMPKLAVHGGSHVYDAIKNLAFFQSRTDFFVILKPEDYWSSGHLESLLSMKSRGVPYCEVAEVNKEIGWDRVTLRPPERGRLTAERILWGNKLVDKWVGRNEDEAVENLLRSPLKLVSTRKHSLIKLVELAAADKTP